MKSALVVKDIFSKVNNWLNVSLLFPEANKDLIQIKKIFIVSNSIAFLGVISMTIISIYLQLNYIINAGMFLLGFYLIYLPLLFFTRKVIELICFLEVILLILLSFVITIYLGGVLNSHGIIFTSLATVIFIVMLRNRVFILITVVLYFLTILFAGLLQPLLSLPAGFSKEFNLLFFTINMTWVSGYIILFIFYFIEEKKRAEIEKNEKLRMLDEARTRLYTNITHEFRTPLTVILGLAERLKLNPLQNYDEEIEIITQNGKNLLKLVNQLLDYSRLESGAMPVHYVCGDVIQYLRYLTDLYQSLAESKKITLHFSTNLSKLEIDYEPEKLSYILSNLLTNSIKFTPDGGLITVTVSIETSRSPELLLCVSDNGIGIPAEELNNIFDRFYQVENKNFKNSTGSGLGLALTREIVKLLGGEITVESKEEKGSVFCVKLPVSITADQNFNVTHLVIDPFLSVAKNHANEFKSSIDTKKTELPILFLVEDNPDVIYYLVSLFEKEYQIEVAENGEKGLKKIIELIPDIVISDIMMPVMDGFTLLEKVKNDIRTSHVPIVMLTAKADMDSRISGLEKGADAYISKPFNEKELLITIKSLLESRKKLFHTNSSMKLPDKIDNINLQREDLFIKQFHEVLEKNFKNELFTINQLAESMGMSRTQLYRKFSALFDKTINEYIRSFRLFKANELLKNTNLNVSQVAYEVGFKNLSHFSHTFHEEFGVNPSEVRG